MELNDWISSYLSVTNFIDSGAFVTSLDFRSKSTYDRPRYVIWGRTTWHRFQCDEFLAICFILC